MMLLQTTILKPAVVAQVADVPVAAAPVADEVVEAALTR